MIDLRCAGPNGAIIHYRAQPGTCRNVDSNTLLLIDSGAQFDCGTTDITRTMHYGTPTEYQKRCYTRVLQGHIGLDQAIFPEGTVGAALDTLARLPLWKEGLNYRHGTGHGVGAHLNVHEGPQSISTRYYITTPLAAKMVSCPVVHLMVYQGLLFDVEKEKEKKKS
ncbi:peptidase M24, structural domain-containing protein [Dunaliella salina]|uniref:Peptidase M24, structural domain-containing protein n=1 Tax=Dunaliella salina TaxID=3046 RepID=A0ABQ7HA40_DUNSA|nr:peptidase M24, structural domain-containing protein [Dunaliella salina]|eukprot:KAF5843715.1 peptidase M24, structural domain-containing protein [Dunaliella salina]